MTKPDEDPFSGEDDVRSAWQSQVAEAVRTPLLARLFTQGDGELFLRFAASYEQLRSLPRRARRSLQRQLARSMDLSKAIKERSGRQAGRALKHKLAWSVAGAALLLALGQSVQAATITVDTTNPAVNLGDGSCSLIEAIVAANTNAAYDACAAGSGADTIILPGGTHTIAAPNSYSYGYNGLPLITSTITIEGNGASIKAKKSTPPFRIATVTATGNLTLDSVTLSGGSSYYGGAIRNLGTLTVQNSNITKNRSPFGAGIYSYNGTTTIVDSQVSKNQGYSGAGIWSRGATADLTVTNSSISGNKAQGPFFASGAGIFNSGTLTIQNSLVSKNQTKAKYVTEVAGVTFGAGIDHVGGSAAITNSTIDKNKAIFGGGVYNSATMTIENSTISKNSVKDTRYFYSTGGGIDNTGGTLTIVNSTLSGNKATGGYGGGVNNFSGGTLIVDNSTITRNQAKLSGGGIFSEDTSSLTLQRSLISGNKVPKSGFGPEISTYGTFTVDDFNLFGSNNDSGITGAGVPGATDIVPAAGVQVNHILSSSLTNNGGPTATHALVAGSPAIDASPNDAGCPDTDQRGVERPQGAACDIGAFEGPP